MLLWQGHGIMSSLSVARGREESLLPRMVHRGIHSLGFSSCAVLSCVQLKALGHVKLTWTPSCAKKDFASASVAS